MDLLQKQNISLFFKNLCKYIDIDNNKVQISVIHYIYYV